MDNQKEFWSKKKPLSDKELEDILNNLSESEDGFDFDDDDSVIDPDFVPDAEQLGHCHDTENDDEIVTANFAEDATESVINNISIEQNGEPSIVQPVQSVYSSGKDITWRKRNLILADQQLQFFGDMQLPEHILALETPYEFFSLLFTNATLDRIVEESNLYAIQKNPNKPLNLTRTDVKQFIGITMYMSLVHMPNTRDYWSEEIGYEKIRKIMSANRYEKIRQFLHFNNNDNAPPRDHPDYDRIYKIRPLVDSLNKEFSNKIPLEQYLSVDEQICSTKARHYLKQYLPNKPHKWGFKFFVLCGSSGYAYNIELYTGQENEDRRRPASEPNISATANVVIRLSRIIPRNMNHRLYFDNYYTSIPLLVYLAKQGIYSLGTARRNRIPNCKLPDEKQLKNSERGTSVEFTGTCDGVEISSVVWKDNKLVNLLSTFAGEIPKTSTKRYDKKEKKTKEIDCPFVVKEYNRHMGGVDLLDSNLGRGKILQRSKKWYFRIFYHLLDLTVANSWILYKKTVEQKTGSKPKITQCQFRAKVAQALCMGSERFTIVKRGRPSSSGIEESLQLKKKKGPAQVVPVKDVRKDGVDHWPSWSDKQIRCKYPQCKGYSHIVCEKCGVALCFTARKHCFKEFHTN